MKLKKYFILVQLLLLSTHPSSLLAQQNAQDPLAMPLANYPIATVRIAFHIIQKSKEDPQNFTEAQLPMLYKLADQLSANRQWPQPLEPNPLNVKLEDVRVRFLLDTITFFATERYWDFSNTACRIDTVNCRSTCRSKMDSLYHDYITDNTTFDSITKFHTLHVFFVGMSRTNGCYSGEAYGFSHAKWAMLRTSYDKYKMFGEEAYWQIFLLLNHEVSHCFGLYHVFESKACCYNTTYKSGGTNNVMDYWPGGGASIAPCQGQTMLSTIITKGNQPFALNNALVPDCSHMQPYRWVIPKKAKYVIEKSWLVQLDRSIEISDSATLIVKGQLYLPSKSGAIILKKGATLLLDGGTISNRCGDSWQGVYYQNKTKNRKINLSKNSEKTTYKSGTIYLKNNAKIINVEGDN